MTDPHARTAETGPALTALSFLIDDVLPPDQAGSLAEQVGSGMTTPREALRTLLTIRRPGPLPDDVGTAIDAVLESEREARVVVEAEGIPTLDSTHGIAGALGRNVALWRGDLTLLRADAIVNAANSAMLGCFVPGHACIDNAVHNTAGPALREECAAHITAQGYPEPTGTVTVTRGYHLPAAHVFHTVGPIIRGALTADDESKLSSCYTAILDTAESMPDVQTVGLCSVSTGVFGYPKTEAARLVLATIDTWLSAHPHSRLRIIVSLFAEPDERVYEAALPTAGDL